MQKPQGTAPTRLQSPPATGRTGADSDAETRAPRVHHHLAEAWQSQGAQAPTIIHQGETAHRMSALPRTPSKDGARKNPHDPNKPANIYQTSLKLNLKSNDSQYIFLCKQNVTTKWKILMDAFLIHVFIVNYIISNPCEIIQSYVYLDAKKLAVMVQLHWST